MRWAAGRRPRGSLLAQGACPAGCAPHSLFGCAKKRMRRARWKRKSASAGRSAPAQTSCRRRGMVGTPLQKSGTETRRPWGDLWPGEVWDTLSLSPRCRSRSHEEQPAAAKREAARCDNHPDKAGTIRHGTEVPKNAEGPNVPEGGPKSEQAPIRRPPSRGGPLHRSAPKRFFLFHRARRILFLSRTKREWGAHPCGNSPLRERRSPLR